MTEMMNANRMNESHKEAEKLADDVLRVIIQDAKKAFPEYTDEQIWDFALLVIRKCISRLKTTPKQLNFDF